MSAIKEISCASLSNLHGYLNGLHVLLTACALKLPATLRTSSSLTVASC